MSNGLIRTPTAWLNEQGDISFLYSNYDPFVHGRLTLSPYDWVQGSFYYTDINTQRYGGSKQSNKDKGFALKFKIKDQGTFPAVSIGFEDIAGTALFSSEYIVSSYHKNNLEFSLGIGWGRLGSMNNIVNPFLVFGDSQKKRLGSSNEAGGTLAFGNYFRGDASLFGGLKYRISRLNNFSFKLEYDSINFDSQLGYNAKESTRYNYGLYFEPVTDASVGIYRTEGNDLGFSFQYKKDFSIIKKNEFSQNNDSRHDNLTYIKILNDGLENGILVQKANIEEKEIHINYIQLKRNNEKIFAKEYVNFLEEKYEKIEKIVLTPKNGAITKDSYVFRKGILKEIGKEFAIPEQDHEFQPQVQYPANSMSITPGTKTHIGSPSGFIFGEINLNLNFSSVINKSLEFDSKFTYPLVDNYEDLNYEPAYTDLYPVRIDAQRYLKYGQVGFDTFYISKISQINLNNYLLLSFGHLEQMYSGVYFEYLRDLPENNIQIGFDLAYVKQRGFEKGFFDFLEYQTYTSHINISYYEPYLDFYADLSFGRYLAKDDGFTFSLSRAFKNGLEIGTFFTLTNITEKQFGEGSFDKGIFFNYPIDIFRSNKSKGNDSFLYRPLTRDGGSKVYAPKTLKGILRDPSRINY